MPAPEEGPTELPVAALLLTADTYENLEAQSQRPLSDNRTGERLLWPHRVIGDYRGRVSGIGRWPNTDSLMVVFEPKDCAYLQPQLPSSFSGRSVGRAARRFTSGRRNHR